ncbi:MAG: hypothetical protein HY289_01610, partial [Planctomycetes bacterium]|nr:hypothetical protein [Planctomycetota bacterium]
EEDPDKRMDKEELKMEVDWHDDTLRYQKHALKRLDNLLDSIKEEIAKMDEKKERERNNPPDPDKMPPEDNNNPPPRPGDGIPPMAQLKALRAEQADLLERTEKFAKDHKGKKIPDELNDPAKEELQRLSDEQTELHRLFQEILPAQQPMPQPEQKEQKEEKKGAPK